MLNGHKPEPPQTFNDVLARIFPTPPPPKWYSYRGFSYWTEEVFLAVGALLSRYFVFWVLACLLVTLAIGLIAALR